MFPIFKSVKSEQVLFKYQERQLISKKFLQNKHCFLPPAILSVQEAFYKKRWIFLPQLNRQVSTPFSISFQVTEMLLITIYKYVKHSYE